MTRRVIWLRIPKADLLDDVPSLHEGLLLSNNVILFIDRAMFFAAQG